MKSVTLYKKDTKNKIRQWTIYTEGASIIEESGVLAGAFVRHKKTAKSKNIGKSNETTPVEQAELEAKALITDKLSKDYFRTVEEATETSVELPMLAKSYKDCASKIDWTNCWVQPKLDGMRCHMNHNRIISRDNKDISTMNHLWNVIKSNPFADTFDGELYAHGYSFQENMSFIKKYVQGTSELVTYHVYDLCLNIPFPSRYALLKNLVKQIKNKSIELVPTYQVRSEDEMKEYHKKFLAEGYEGTIIRWGTAGYKYNGRSENLLKYKDFIDYATTITDIIPMDAQPTHGMVVAEMNGGTFKATPKMSHSEREELLTNKNNYIGKTGEFRYFEETDEKLPRFPVFLGIRLDK